MIKYSDYYYTIYHNIVIVIYITSVIYFFFVTYDVTVLKILWYADHIIEIIILHDHDCSISVIFPLQYMIYYFRNRDSIIIIYMYTWYIISIVVVLCTVVYITHTHHHGYYCLYQSLSIFIIKGCIYISLIKIWIPIITYDPWLLSVYIPLKYDDIPHCRRWRRCVQRLRQVEQRWARVTHKAKQRKTRVITVWPKTEI